MKMVEIAYNKEVKELEKLIARLERSKRTYEKKLETAKKYGVENWDNNDRHKWLETVETSENGFIVNKSDIKINSAWFDMVCAEDAEFEKEQKQWAKDGITLEARYYGTTPNGKRFYIERNNGVTFRSMHCFTLTIDGETIFTSGEFWRAYAEIKRR